MIHIKFVVPSENRWARWREDCEKATLDLIRVVEQEGGEVTIIDHLYKRDGIIERYYHAGKKGGIAPFHGKCSFCESGSEILHVEHFRPKKAVAGVPGHHGYYWLAYDYRNLLLACDDCNVGRKQNRFPLEDESKRAWKSTDDLTSEAPYLLNPLIDDPREHLGIDLETGALVHKTARGKKIIEVLGLNERESLRFARLVLVDSIRIKWEVAKRDPDPSKRALALQFLRECAEGRHPFTLAARAALKQLMKAAKALRTESRQGT